MKNKVCFVAPLPPPYGGIANWTAMMQRYLDKECSEQIEYTVIDISPHKRVTEGRTVFERVFGGGIGMLKAVKKVKKHINQKRPDCVHITTSGSLSLIRDYMILKTVKRKGIRSIYHIRFGRIPEYLVINDWKSKLFRRCADLSDCIIAIDEVTYQSLSNTIWCKKVRLIGNPVYLDELPSLPMHRNRTISFVGWVIKEKGIEDLLEAWQQIQLCRRMNEATKMNSEKWKLQIIGPYRNEYLEYLMSVYQCDNVAFLGEQSHEKTMELVNSGIAFVLPSYSEGFPNAVVEAMGLRQQIVATAVGAIPEMLSDECGMVVEPKNAEAIQQALIKIIDEKDDKQIEYNEKMAVNAYQKAHQLYDIRKIVDKYSEEWTYALR